MSHPFRLTPGGQVAVVVDGTPPAHVEAVAVLALTRRGERPLVPTFGTPDPTFTGVDAAEINAGLALHGPAGIAVTGIETTYPAPGVAAVTLTVGEGA